MPKQPYRSDDAPTPAGPYSPAVRKGAMVQVAGQVGIDAATGELVGDSLEAQTRRTLANVATLLAAAGATMDDVIMMRVYLTDRAHFAAMNAVYAEHVTEPYPARTTVYTGLAPGVLVEIDALAVTD